MRGRIRSRLTFSNIVAVIALFIALGGSAYAATQLKKNSVGTKQLKKNSVNGAKVKDQSLTGKDINLAKLGTVPTATNAASATSAGTASALTPPEALRLVGTPGQPPFQDGTSNPTPEGGINVQPVAFYKDHEGIVHLEGIAISGSEELLFTLPPGFRPATNTVLAFQTGKSTLLIAGTGVSGGGKSFDGEVLQTGSSGESVFLSGITYRAQS